MLTEGYYVCLPPAGFKKKPNGLGCQYSFIIGGCGGYNNRTLKINGKETPFSTVSQQQSGEPFWLLLDAPERLERSPWLHHCIHHWRRRSLA